MHVGPSELLCSVLSRVDLRCTTATPQVPAVFSDAHERLLAHAKVHASQKRKKLSGDKVIRDRLVDRLATASLLHKVVEQDRFARFGGNSSGAQTRFVHPRWECRACLKCHPLADRPERSGRALQQAMAQWEAYGHRGHEAETAVQRVCAQCVPH